MRGGADGNKKRRRMPPAKSAGSRRPDIVICGGTEKPYVKATNTKPKWKMTSRGIWYFVEDSGTIVISYSHPEARTKECMLHYALIDAVREILAHTDSNTEI